MTNINPIFRRISTLQYLFSNPCWLIKRVWWKIKEEKLIPNDIMSFGEPMNIPLPHPKYGDTRVHPCVRYFNDGFCGYKWWLVISPYPELDERNENILLYKCNQDIPHEWEFVKVIHDTPETGFNSDPNLFFHNGKLWVIWRECKTENIPQESDYAAVFGCYTQDGKDFSEISLLARNEFRNLHDKWGDTEMCPIVQAVGDSVMMYATYYMFEGRREPLGISIYEAENISDSLKFSYKQSIKYNFNFNFWHFDLFEYNQALYCITTSEHGSAIYIGKAEDYAHFQFAKPPLLSELHSGKAYFYKPSAVVKDDKLFLFYPSGNHKSAQIHLSIQDMEDVLKQAFPNG